MPYNGDRITHLSETVRNLQRELTKQAKQTDEALSEAEQWKRHVSELGAKNRHLHRVNNALAEDYRRMADEAERQMMDKEVYRDAFHRANAVAKQSAHRADACTAMAQNTSTIAIEKWNRADAAEKECARLRAENEKLKEESFVGRLKDWNR